MLNVPFGISFSIMYPVIDLLKAEEGGNQEIWICVGDITLAFKFVGIKET
jgi:hypothetical protein